MATKKTTKKPVKTAEPKIAEETKKAEPKKVYTANFDFRLGSKVYKKGDAVEVSAEKAKDLIARHFIK